MAITLLSLLVLSNVAYCFWHDSAAGLTALLLLQNGLWIGLYRQRSPVAPKLLLSAFLLSFVLVKFSPPAFEDDYYRYFWDGHQLVTTGDPYGSAPANITSDSYEHIRNKINFPEVPTIYPPMAMSLFGFLYLLSPNLNIFLCFLSFGGIAFFGFSYFRLMRYYGLSGPLGKVALVLLHPLVLKEWGQSNHFDSWFVALLMLALSTPSTKVAGLWIGLGTNVKYLSAICLGVLPARNKREWALGLGAFLLSFILPWIFFTQSIGTYWEGLRTFGSEWEMNSGFYRWVREGFMLLGWDYWPSANISRGLSVLVFGASLAWLWRPKLPVQPLTKLFFALLTMVLLAPVANTWYFTWSLPLVLFLPEKKRMPLLLGYSLLPLSYLFFLGETFPFERFWDLEHLGLWTAVVLTFPGINLLETQWIRHKLSPKK